MELEKELKEQRTFANDAQKAIVNLFFSYYWTMQRFDLFLENEDISTQQYNCIRILQRAKKPISTRHLKDYLLQKNSDVSRLIERLVNKGLVETATNQEDQRKLDITLTEKAKQILSRLELKFEELWAIMKNLTPAEQTQLNFLLDKMRG